MFQSWKTKADGPRNEERSKSIQRMVRTSERKTNDRKRRRERKKEEKEKRERAKDRRIVVLADDEVALLLSLNTMRGSWANSDRSETARRLTPPVPMGAHKTRALGGPEPPLASSTLVQPIINKACLDPNALYSDIPASALDSELAAAPIPPFSPLSPPSPILFSSIFDQTARLKKCAG